LWRVGFVRGQIATTTLESYARKNEPLGKFMTAISDTEKTIKETSEAMQKQVHAMVSAAEAANIKMTEISRKLRDTTDKFGSALAKFSVVSNDTQFAERVKNAESLVSSLERLAQLQSSGMLEKVISAMGSK
jgi:ABC-type transporter Mla subunit MlaD